MAKLIRVGSAAEMHEFNAQMRLGQELPEDYLVLANCQVPDRGAMIEADALVLSAQGVFILEIKNWHGDLVGSELGVWHNQRTEVKNPLIQVKAVGQNVKSFITNKEHAKKIFLPDPRVANSIRTWVCVIFCDDQTNLSNITYDGRPAPWMLGCMTIPTFTRKLGDMRALTMHRMKFAEMRNLGELLGASKQDLDEWLARQPNQAALSPAPPAVSPTPPIAHPFVAPTPVAPAPIIQPTPPPPQTRQCPKPNCRFENRAQARFCKKCGQPF